MTNQGLWSAFQGGRHLAVCLFVSEECQGPSLPAAATPRPTPRPGAERVAHSTPPAFASQSSADRESWYGLPVEILPRMSYRSLTAQGGPGLGAPRSGTAQKQHGSCARKHRGLRATWLQATPILTPWSVGPSVTCACARACSESAWTHVCKSARMQWTHAHMHRCACIRVDACEHTCMRTRAYPGTCENGFSKCKHLLNTYKTELVHCKHLS